MNKHTGERLGEWAAIGHMVMDGFWPVGANYGVQFLPPTELLGIATLIGGIFFIVLTLKKGQLHQLFHWKVISRCFLYTALLLIPYVAIFYATQYTSAINTALFTQSEVVFAALIGWLFLKEKAQATRWIGVFCVVVSNVVVLYQGQVGLNSADLVLVGFPLFFVIGNSVAKQLQHEGLGYAPLLLFRGAVGGVTLLVFSVFLEDAKVPSLNLWPFLIVFGFFAFGIPKALWQIALRHTDLSKTTAIGLSYPIVSFAIAYLWLHEVPSSHQWVGLLVSFVGIFFLMRSSSRRFENLAIPTD